MQTRGNQSSCNACRQESVTGLSTDCRLAENTRSDSPKCFCVRVRARVRSHSVDVCACVRWVRARARAFRWLRCAHILFSLAVAVNYIR
jgi:hypothetical protein